MLYFRVDWTLILFSVYINVYINDDFYITPDHHIAPQDHPHQRRLSRNSPSQTAAETQQVETKGKTEDVALTRGETPQAGVDVILRLLKMHRDQSSTGMR